MRKCCKLTTLSLGISLITVLTTLGESPVSFAEARERILAQNFGLKSTQTETDAWTVGVSQAGKLHNPDIGVSLDNLGNNEIEANFEQTIELGGKRRLRTKAARIEADAAVNAVSKAQFDLEAEIVRRFVPIITLKEKILVIDSLLVITEKTRDHIQQQVEAGGSKVTDLIRIEIAIEQLQIERDEMFRERASLRIKFAALGNGRDKVLMEVEGVLDNGAKIPELESLRVEIEKNPTLKAMLIEQARLEIERKQLRAQAFPDLNLSAGYLMDNTENSGSPIIGLSMTIPVFNTNTAAQKQAKLKYHAVGERRENDRRLLQADIEEIYSQLKSIDKKIIILQSSTIPKAQRVFSLIQDYYNAGNASFLDLAEAQSELLQLRLELLDVQQERAFGLADLMQITAKKIEIIK